jgi:hypothetical protein
MPKTDRASKRGALEGGRSENPGALATLLLPASLAVGLGLLALTPRVQANPVLLRSFLGAAGFLVVWVATVMLLIGSGRVRPPKLETVLRAQHYIQACCQIAVLGYWGWYWRPVYYMAVLFAAQIAFAYAFGMLLSWTRGAPYRIGFGPVPIILSINLFLWFRDDWFYLQFLMIGVGFLGKELIRWERGGRRVHIFNPSAFALGLFSLALIATDSTGLTWGQEIASTLTLAPGIYLYLFLVGLVVMHFFSITLIAATAAMALFSLSAGYAGWTGVPYFLDSEIPAAVFLGLHLLVTDPSTSPRTALGKTIFGVLYGLGVFALYWVLGAAGAPTFYDKLLCVPLLNLSVRAIDDAVRRVRPAFAGFGSGRRPPDAATVGAGGEGPASWRDRLLVPVGWPNLAHMGVWVLFFGAMAATGRTDGRHQGDSVPFWEAACAEGRRNACTRLISVESTYCGDNSAWACNELGRHYSGGEIVEADASLGSAYFTRACELRLQAACMNLLEPDPGLRTDPRPLDLRLLLREGGLNLMQMPEAELYARACDHGWAFACDRMAAAG